LKAELKQFQFKVCAMRLFDNQNYETGRREKQSNAANSEVYGTKISPTGTKNMKSLEFKFK